MRRTLIIATLGLGSLTLSACGDSGYGGYGPMPYVPTLTSYIGTTDAVVAWGNPYSGDYAVAPAGSYAGKRQNLHGTVDPLSGVALNQPAGVEVYKYSDGHIYALDLTTTAQPQPTQISSESAATLDDLCSFVGTGASGANSGYHGVFFAGDAQTPTNDSYFYRLPGPDGVCNTADDIVHLVKTGMSATTAPLVAAAMPIVAVHNSLGAITGFVAASGASLVLYDSNFGNPVTLGTFGAPIGVAVALPVGLTAGYPSGQLFDVDGNIVYVDFVAHSVSATLFAIPGWTASDPHALFAASPATLFFAVNGTNAATLYAMPANGTAAPTALLTPAGSVSEIEFPVQSTNLVYATLSPNFNLYALSQAGGTPTLLLAGTRNSGRFTATAASVYYTTWTLTTDSVNKVQTRSATQSGIVGVDGSVIAAPLANSCFVAGGEYAPWPTDGSLTVLTALEYVFRVQGLTSVTVVNATTGWTTIADGVSGGTMVTISTASDQAINTVGTLPVSKAVDLQATMRSSVDSGFVQASNALSTQNAATRDEYLFNAGFSYSLERMTGNL